MNTRASGGEPAYPVQGEWYGEKLGGQYAHGLTKREVFAMAAMQAFIGTAAGPVLGGLDGAESRTAKAAFRMADYMLAESAALNGEQEHG